MNRAEAYLRLVRIQNVLTPTADVWAGYAAAGGSEAGAVALATGGSCCLYSAGMALNGIVDVARDRAEHPNRPLVTGAVSRAEAGILTGALAACGLGLLWAAGREPLVGGLALVFGIAVYHFGAKTRDRAGPAVMGLLRGGNLLLGAMAASPRPGHAALAGASGLAWYVGWMTWASTFEGRNPRHPAPLRAAMAMMGAAALVAAAFGPRPSTDTGLLLLGFAVFWMVRAARLEAADRDTAEAVVRDGLRGLIVFDGIWAFGFAPLWALAIWCLLPCSLLAGRWGKET